MKQLFIFLIVFTSSCTISEKKKSLWDEPLPKLPYSSTPVKKIDSIIDTKYKNKLPSQFVMKSTIFGIGNDMSIDNDGEIDEKVLSMGRTFNYNYNNTFIAKASTKVFSIGTKIVVTDDKNNIIGRIEQQILESMFSIYSKYYIYDSNDNIIAVSNKLDFFTSSVTIDGSKCSIAMNKRVFSMTDTWDVSIQGEIDERLVVFIPAFISASQSDKKKKK